MIAEDTSPVGSRMLCSVRLRNFKSHLDSGKIPFAPLTVLLGCNNAGKSSIMQAVLALKQTLDDSVEEDRLITNGNLVDLGGFFDIRHARKDKRTCETIGIAVEANVQTKLRASFDVDFAFDDEANRITVPRASFSGAGPKKPLELSEAGADATPKKMKGVIARLYLKNFLPALRIQPRSGETLPPSIFHQLDDAMRHEFTATMWRQLFGRIIHIGAIRSHVPQYAGIGEQSGPLRTGGDVLRSLANPRKVAKDKGTLLESVNHWMADMFKAIPRLLVKNWGTSQVRSLVVDDTDVGIEINVSAMGEGVSQLLPIVVNIIESAPKSILFVEQPEVHLHPTLQADIADLLIAAVANDNKQVIVETHSEHLVMRLRRRIAEGKTIAADKVSILHVERENGVSTVKQLSLDSYGQMDDWPKGFFDQAYKEAMALALAQPVAKGNDGGTSD